MIDSPRFRKFAEAAAAIPGVAAALYAAIAYDQGSDPEGLLVGAFSWLVDLQAGVLGGEYYPKLTILVLALPLILPPSIAVQIWLRSRSVDTIGGATNDDGASS
jgi:hypothetical protein